MTQEEKDKRLEQLRKDWLDKPWLREIIEHQAKALKMFADKQQKLV